MKFVFKKTLPLRWERFALIGNMPRSGFVLRRCHIINREPFLYIEIHIKKN
jgi:hypothetical protein